MPTSYWKWIRVLGFDFASMLISSLIDLQMLEYSRGFNPRRGLPDHISRRLTQRIPAGTTL